MIARALALLLVLAPLGCGDDTSSDGSGSDGSGSTGTGPTGGATDSGEAGTTTGSSGADETASVTGEPSTSTSSSDGTTTGEPGEDCVVHVDAAQGNDASHGFSWLSAKQTLGAGLELAFLHDCDVWVAAGTYLPSESDDPTESFVLFAGALVYGGFEGGEALLEERDFVANPTVLSGDLGALGVIDDNALHVVIGADGARLDGFEVTGGYARDPSAGSDGAGLRVTEGSMTVANCRFSANRSGDAPPPEVGTIGVDGGGGAGIGFVGQDLVVEGCTFADNVTGSGSEGPAIGGWGGAGAGLRFQGASLVVTGSTFTDNLTGDAAAGGDVGGAGGSGAGLYFWGDELVVQDCSFMGNVTGAGGAGGSVGGSGGSGAAIAVRGGSVRIVATDFLGNAGGPGGFGSAVGGGGAIGGAVSIESHSGSVVIDRCLFEGNAAGEGGGSTNLVGGAGIGGAIFLRGDVGEVLVAHGTFFDNTAGAVATGYGAGGAVAMMPSNPAMPQGDATLIGNVFAGNSASTGGAAWLISKGAAAIDVIGCAFGNNAAIDGSAILYRSQGPEGVVGSTLVDSILWGDPSTTGREVLADPGFVGDPVAPLTISSSIVDGGCTPGAALVCGAGILLADPLYADPGLGDLHPLGPAGIDQGDDAALPADALDLDGDGDLAEPWSRDLDDAPRVAGVAVDLGPYEAP
jgi:hypothetical protein